MRVIPMPLTLRILLAIASSLAGLGAIYMILVPGSLPNERALELGAVTLLLTVVLLNTAWDTVTRPQPEARPETGQTGRLTAEAPPPRDEPIVGEIAKVLGLLKTHAEANASFSTTLDRARGELHESLKAEQVRTIISYLMVENDKMRSRTADLQQNLETSQRQIERLKSNLADAEEQGLSDPLTGLRNRRSFDIMLASQVASARNSTLPMCLIIADIDHFKSINDRYGHPTGDEVLKWFAKILSSNVKGRDTVARYGGEEFAIIMPQTTLENAATIAEQVKAQLNAHYWQKPGAPNTLLKVTSSFGVAQLTNGEGTSGLIARADAKLYEAKAGGRNRVAV
jgi:diguanylate cyclase